MFLPVLIDQSVWGLLNAPHSEAGPTAAFKPTLVLCALSRDNICSEPAILSLLHRWLQRQGVHAHPLVLTLAEARSQDPLGLGLWLPHLAEHHLLSSPCQCADDTRVWIRGSRGPPLTMFNREPSLPDIQRGLVAAGEYPPSMLHSTTWIGANEAGRFLQHAYNVCQA